MTQLPNYVPDDPKPFDPSNYIYPAEYEGHFESCLIPCTEIRVVVKQLALQIREDYKHCRPVLLCTLKGACPFFVHLLDELQELGQGYDLEFVRASSYEGTNSTGKVNMMGELHMHSVNGRHLIIVEDIVDTGKTLSTIIPIIQESGKPASLEVVSLLDKRLPDKHFAAKYVGFSIPDKFVIGYGLDYNELYRDLKDVFVISKAGIDFDRKNLKH